MNVAVLMPDTGNVDADAVLAPLFARLRDRGSVAAKIAHLKFHRDRHRHRAGRCFTDSLKGVSRVEFRGAGRTHVLIADELDRAIAALETTGGSMQIAYDIQLKVLKIVAHTTGRDPDRLALGDRFVEDLAVDSTDSIEIVMYVEDEFGIELPDDEAHAAKTVASLIELVGRKVQGRATAGAA